MKYFLIAGEASGDLHASALIEQLREQDPQAEFAFLGGDLMAQASGRQPVIHYRDMAYMGFVEVARHAGQVLRNFKRARRAIDEFKPDRLILIDYPSFNLKMAAHARKRGIEVCYYISPKVWAWKSWRVKTIKKVVDKMLVIFPFEVPFYAERGMAVNYVGNPSVEEVDAKLAAAPGREEFIKRNRLPERKKIIALLPGSRMSEIRTNLPLMVDAAKRFPQYRAVIAGAPGIDPAVYERYGSNIPVVHDQTFDLLANSHAAVVTSGTATLETALAGVPQVAVFRNCGSKLVYKIMRRIIKGRFVTLPNLIADDEIIPELLLHLCTADTIAD
nr:lipid-A-disaccharide synthase [Muribaculaceae bacterium]